MNDEQILKACEKVIINYLGRENSDENIVEIIVIQSETNHIRLKSHLKSMISLLEKGIEIIERNNKQ